MKKQMELREAAVTEARDIIAAAHHDGRQLSDRERVSYQMLMHNLKHLSGTALVGALRGYEELRLINRILVSVLTSEQIARFSDLYRAEFEEVAHA